MISIKVYAVTVKQTYSWYVYHIVADRDLADKVAGLYSGEGYEAGVTPLYVDSYDNTIIKYTDVYEIRLDKQAKIQSINSCAKDYNNNDADSKINSLNTFRVCYLFADNTHDAINHLKEEMDKVPIDLSTNLKRARECDLCHTYAQAMVDVFVPVPIKYSYYKGESVRIIQHEIEMEYAHQYICKEHLKLIPRVMGLLLTDKKSKKL